MERLNPWLTLFANLGVLIGIIFLSLEISQSNRIAIRDARSDLQIARTEINMAAWENAEVAELMVKLRKIDSNLTPTEEYQALSYARLQISQAITITANFEGGFLTEEILARNLQGSRRVIRRLQGLAPYLRQAIDELGITDIVFGTDGPAAMRNIGDEIRRMEQD